MQQNFRMVLKDFEQSASPTAHLDSLTEKGGSGAYSSATNVDVTTPGILTQGPGLSTLTNGTEAGAITELVNYIMDIPTATDVAYCIAATKLHKISATTVTNSGGVFPRTITGATSGSSVIEFQGSVYYFFNKASGADIGKYDQVTTFDDDWGSTVPTGMAALQSAPHPVAKKEDILVFGNGRYLGTYVSSSNTLAPTKLDFGVATEVADVCFNANQWWVAVNSTNATGANRTKSQIYLWDGAALTSQLSDEVAVGVQKIGFLMPINGTIFVAYQDVSGSCAIGYISGRSIKPLVYFSSLPTFAQKTLFKNFILFVNGASLSVAGSATPDFPYSISQYADGGFSTVGAVAAPFGTPIVASTQSTSFKLARLSGFDVTCDWRSLVMPIAQGRMVGHIDYVIVKTKNLGANASCALQLEYNQAQVTGGTAQTITTANKRRHTLKQFANPPQGVEDIRVFVSWAGGSTTNDCAIKQIEIIGHLKEM